MAETVAAAVVAAAAAKDLRSLDPKGAEAEDRKRREEAEGAESRGRAEDAESREEAEGSVVSQLVESQQVALMEATKAVVERGGVSMPGHLVIQADNNSAPSIAACAPSDCSIVSSVPSPTMPSNSLWFQPLWMQMELLQQGRVPGLTIGADPKELYICFV